MSESKNILDFFEESDSYGPISFFRWMGYEYQNEKSDAHSLYRTLITKAQDSAELKENAESMLEQWDKSQVDGTIADYWKDRPQKVIRKMDEECTEFLIKDLLKKSAPSQERLTAQMKEEEQSKKEKEEEEEKKMEKEKKKRKVMKVKIKKEGEKEKKTKEKVVVVKEEEESPNTAKRKRRKIETHFITAGLQCEVDDDVWEAIWESIHEVKVLDLDPAILLESHQWASLASKNTYGQFLCLLQEKSPTSNILKQALLRLTSTQELWTTIGSKNEARFLKNLFSPCLDAVFGGQSNVLNITFGGENTIEQRFVADLGRFNQTRTRTQTFVGYND
ncbi:hypothetical protein BGZ46_006272 [Entomortierella lignicola]|nr:hypothetical protein BGZ46_006272 [Entomortierella lignicola]